MNWDKKTLGEIYKIEKGSVQTGPFGSQLHESDYKQSGVPVIMPKDIKNDKLDLSNIAFISDDDAKRLSQHIVKKNDIVCPRRGEIGKRIIIDDDNVGAFCGTGCIRLRGSGSILNQEFLFYFLKQPTVVKWIENQAIGATMMNLNTSILKSIPIKYPKIDSQKNIVKILSSYDELIDNNKQRISLLEEMAEEIYKEWFVRLRFPGYENTKIADGLPEGWEKKPVDEFKSFSMSKAKLKKFNGTKTYLATADVIEINITGSGEIIDWENKPSRAQLLPELNSVFFARMSNTYKVLVFCKSNQELVDELALTSGFLGLKAINEESLPYLFWLIKSNTFHNYKDVFSNGATQVSLTNDGFHKIKLIEPSLDVIEKFGKTTLAFLSEIITLNKKNQLLQETRDLLLPRLISGKLSVEHLVEKEELMMVAEERAEYKKVK
ncbi:restriction endonuclease subunit S [Frigoriflavimonas asaccharolytica]|uniref:Type I restriction enzyme S subunit n=1 Tax=Frigoriflavimonas asaccharolytica TaxID=2735899 RepID=A0A8J8G9T1_9FLAO|nr:restriction endonuclease subunit S [Frigoriflavimonas asaccharolytica]NRS91597.1 type I restriction enzyme S subunit [Frigoriflavimonas asaccharolytica]